MVDETCVPLKEEFHRRYVSSIPNLKNYDVVCDLHFRLHKTGMEEAWRFHQASMDLTDFTIINHVIALRCGE